MNLADMLRSSSRVDPSATALRHGDRRVDYLALEMAAQRVATLLRKRHGVAPGDRVAVLLPDVPEFAFAAYGILWAGATVVALEPETPAEAVGAAISRSTAKLIIAWHACAEHVFDVARTLSLGCLFVEPGEFSRLLAGVAPGGPLATVRYGDPALLVDASRVAGLSAAEGPVELGHGEISLGALLAARRMAIAPGDVIAGPPSLVDPSIQTWTLHAAVASGATVLLGAGGDDRATVEVASPGQFERVSSAVQAAGAREVMS